jgi:hypothetical protein
MMDPPVTTTANEVRRLRGVELLLAALLLCIGAAQMRGRDRAWPFIAWPMYKDPFPPPPRQVSEIQLRLVSREGQVTKVMPYTIFGHVEIALGHEVAVRAFADRPDRDAYRDVLMRRLQPLLSANDAVQVQAWWLTWRTKPRELPPLDLEHPSTEFMLGSIDCAAARDDAASYSREPPR